MGGATSEVVAQPGERAISGVVAQLGGRATSSPATGFAATACEHDARARWPSAFPEVRAGPLSKH